MRNKILKSCIVLSLFLLSCFFVIAGRGVFTDDVGMEGSLVVDETVTAQDVVATGSINSTKTNIINSSGSGIKINTSGKYCLYQGQERKLQDNPANINNIGRGNSSLDDFCSRYEYDFHCDSTDTECSDEFGLAYQQGGAISLEKEVYPYGNCQQIYNDTFVDGNGATINITGTNCFGNWVEDGATDVRNSEFENIKWITDFKKNQEPLFNFTDIDSFDRFSLQYWEANGFNVSDRDGDGALFFARKNCVDDKFTNFNVYAGKAVDIPSLFDFQEATCGRKASFLNFNIDGIDWITDQYQTEIYGEWGYILFLGIDNLQISNIHHNIESDGPAINVLKGRNIDTKNIIAENQQDYTVQYANVQNGKIRNIQTITPQFWGSTIIASNYAASTVPTEHIDAYNIYCENATGGTTWGNFVIKAQFANSPISHITLDGFKFMGSPDNSIEIRPEKSPIYLVNIKNGLINNTKNSGILFQHPNTAPNVTDGVTIENVDFGNIGYDVSDAEYSSAIQFRYSNTTGVKLKDLNFLAHDTVPTYGVRILADTSIGQSFFSGEFENLNAEGSITKVSAAGNMYNYISKDSYPEEGYYHFDADLNVSGSVNASVIDANIISQNGEQIQVEASAFKTGNLSDLGNLNINTSGALNSTHIESTGLVKSAIAAIGAESSATRLVTIFGADGTQVRLGYDDNSYWDINRQGTGQLRFTDGTDTIDFDSEGNITASGLSGNGVGYACIDDNGKLYHSPTTCVP